MKIAILHQCVASDASVDEQDVLHQATVVGEALTVLGHEHWCLPCGLDLGLVRQELCSRQPDVVFNLVESLGGSGRLLHLVPALVESLGLPCTGASSANLMLTTDKPMAKGLMARCGLPTPPILGWYPGSAVRGPATWQNKNPWVDGCIIKSIHEEASIGIDDTSVLRTMAGIDLSTLLAERAKMCGGTCFAEGFVEGREFNLAMLPTGSDGEVEVLPPAEIRFLDFPEGKPRIVNYAAKWDPNAFEFSHTPRSFEFEAGDWLLLEELARLAKKCWTLFGLAGHVRVDFRVDARGMPWILEVNANPCLSPDAGYRAALEQAKISFPQAIERILADALNNN